MDGLGECAEKLKEGTLKPRLDSLIGSKEETAGVNAGKGKEQSRTDMLPSGTTEALERKLLTVGRE